MRFDLQLGGLGSPTTPNGRRLAIGLAALAAAGSLVSFAGWALDLMPLRTFGIAERPIWPLAVLGYASLAAAWLSLLTGHRAAARMLLAVPLALAALAILESVTGDLGIDRMLFGGIVAEHGGYLPGRLSNSSTAVFLLLGAAGLRASATGPALDPLVGALGAGALVLGAAALALIIAASPDEPAFRMFSSSLPASLHATLLAAACIAWSSDFSLLPMLGARRGDRRMARLMLPAAVILPIVPSLASLWLLRTQGPTSLTAELVVVLCNVAIVSVLVYWAVTRITAEHAALMEITEALDAATVAITTPDGRITHWSRGCEQLYGWSAAEALGHDKHALLHSRCQQWWASGLPHPSGDEAQELIERHRDGREIAVLESARRIESRGRDPVVVLSINDISETAAAMAALKASEERLALATAAHQVGVFEWDVPSGRLEWSPGAEQRLGLAAGSLADVDQLTALIDPDDLDAMRETIARAEAERADTYTFRYRLLPPEGGARAIEGSARAIYDDSGNLVRSVGVLLETTERDQREAALRAREAQLRSIIETAPDAMVVLDEEGRILQFSAAAEALWGYRAEDVAGRHFALLAPEAERGPLAAAFARYIATGEAAGVSQRMPAMAETADGHHVPVEVRAGVKRVDRRRIFTVFCRDLSERVAAEERMSELNAELAHVSRQSAMSELAADIAHELNQPLSASVNFLAAARMLIEKGEDGGRVADLLRMGAEQAQRAGEIIRRLRNFMERREVEMRPESIEETIRDAVELVLVGTGQFHIRVRYALDPAAPCFLVDRIQIQQVLVNLLRNATDALRGQESGDREITLESRKLDGKMVEIQVRDTGPGIPETVLESLFSRFATTKRQGSGMGIGLSISKRIIEAHGGALSAENRPEGGATFRFTLPAAGEDGE